MRIFKESVEEPSKLCHPLFQEFCVHGLQELLLWKSGQSICVNAVIEVLLQERLELPHTTVSVFDVEGKVVWSYNLENEVGVACVNLKSDHGHFV